jgi:hypothetical protein
LIEIFKNFLLASGLPERRFDYNIAGEANF